MDETVVVDVSLCCKVEFKWIDSFVLLFSEANVENNLKVNPCPGQVTADS